MPPRKRARESSKELDMGEYKDAKGLIYTIDDEFHTGEIIILSDDLAAWRLKRSVLSEQSPVFRDMFSNASSNFNEVNLPDAKRADLDTFIRTLCRKEPPAGLSVAQTSKAIDLLCQYECTDAARRILYANVGNITAPELYHAFTMASRLNDVMSGCRVLAQGWKWYDADPQPTEPSLCPNSGKRPWGAGEATAISPAWVWALTLATTEKEHRNPPRGDEEPNAFADQQVWCDLVGEFMCNLVK